MSAPKVYETDRMWARNRTLPEQTELSPKESISDVTELRIKLAWFSVGHRWKANGLRSPCPENEEVLRILDMAPLKPRIYAKW